MVFYQRDGRITSAATDDQAMTTNPLRDQPDGASTNLLPCPFCGGTNVEVFGPVGWYGFFGISHSCRVFYGGSGDFTVGARSKDSAIKDWNTRAILDAHPEQPAPDAVAEAGVKAENDRLREENKRLLDALTRARGGCVA